jgi:hypothetical protein
MVRCILSERAKQMACQWAINVTYQKAIDEYLQEQAKPKGKKCGLHPIAAKHGICFKILSNLAKGGQTMSTFNTSKQKLSDGRPTVRHYERVEPGQKTCQRSLRDH